MGDLVAALLEDAHVVDDLAAGWKLKAAQPQSTIATRGGELITRSGLLLVGQEAGASLAVLTDAAWPVALAKSLVTVTTKRSPIETVSSQKLMMVLFISGAASRKANSSPVVENKTSAAVKIK